MIDDPVLLNDWHAVVPAQQLDGAGVVGARLLGEDIVIWRAGDEVLGLAGPLPPPRHAPVPR